MLRLINFAVGKTTQIDSLFEIVDEMIHDNKARV